MCARVCLFGSGRGPVGFSLCSIYRTSPRAPPSPLTLVSRERDCVIRLIARTTLVGRGEVELEGATALLRDGA